MKQRASGLIAVEGIDGTCKTSLVRKIVNAFDWIKATKEPTDSPWGRRVKAGRGTVEDATTDRQQHMTTEVWPALDNGQLVVSDRLYASTAAHQRYTLKGAETEFLRQRLMFGTPDLWVLMRAPLKVVEQRLTDRGEDYDRDKLRMAADFFEYLMVFNTFNALIFDNVDEAAEVVTRVIERVAYGETWKQAIDRFRGSHGC